MKWLFIVLFACSNIGLLYSMQGPVHRGILHPGRPEKPPYETPQAIYASLLRSYRSNPGQLTKDMQAVKEAIETAQTRTPGAVRKLQSRLDQLEKIQAELTQKP